MSEEPDFIAQTFEKEHLLDSATWIHNTAKDFNEKGATFARVSVEQDDHVYTGLLFEGWKVRPVDQGEPRWQLTPLSDLEQGQ